MREAWVDRIEALSDLGSLCFGTDAPTPHADEFLRTQLSFFDQGMHHRKNLSTSGLFGLAATLASASAPDWSIAYAVAISNLAFESVSDIEDLKSYSLLPQWFREGPYQDVGVARLHEALEGEIEGITQQNDRDLMSQWLDEVVLLAEEHGISLYVDNLREEIADMDPVEREINRFTATASPVSAVDGTDEELRALFAMLIA